jgi:hypothetical protein
MSVVVFVDKVLQIPDLLQIAVDDWETIVTEPDPRSTTGTPRWVKVFGIIVIGLTLLVLAVIVSDVGGQHGPGRHMPSGHFDHSSAWGMLVLLGVLVGAGVVLNSGWLVAIGVARGLRRRLQGISQASSRKSAEPRWRPKPMTDGVRKFMLTAHVASSVGFLGSVSAFFALGVAGLTSNDAQMVRAAYLAMELITWSVIAPLSFASLLTGLAQALGTPWGLFRHYWVLVKFLLTLLATIVLLLQRESISYMAAVAAQTTLLSADLDTLRRSLVSHAGAGLLVVLMATTLSIYKPRGMTPYGARKQGTWRMPSGR